MSEETKIEYCSACGAKLADGARFCSICGSAVEVTSTVESTLDQEPTEQISEKKKKSKKPKKERKKKDPYADISAETLYAKGISIEKGTDAPSTMKNATVTKAGFSISDLLSFISSVELVNRIIVFIIAILLFALSFAPFAFSRVTVGFDDTVSIGFSQVDTVELSTRSLLFLTDRQKAKTDLYAELQNPAELSKLSSSQLLKKHLFLDVMSKDVSPRATVIFAAMVGVAYFAVCIIFLIASFIDLVSEIITVRRKKESEHICSRMSDRLFIALMCIMPVMIFAYTQAFNMGIGGVWAKYSGAGSGLAWGGILTVAVIILGAIFVISKNTISLLALSERYFTAAKIRNVICCGLVAIVIMSVSMPCVTFKLSDVKDTEKTAVSVSYSDIIEQSDDDIYEISKTSSEAGKKELDKRINDALSDKLFHKSGTGKQIMDTLLIKFNRMNVQLVYGAITAITFLTLISACILLFFLIIKVFQRARSGVLICVFKIVTIVFAVLNAIMAIVLVVLIYSMTTGIFAITLTPLVGFGAVLMVISSVATIFLRVETKRIRLVDKGYDNADVSYAPYVLDR